MIDRSTFQCYIKALKIYLNMYIHFVLCAYNVADEIHFINKTKLLLLLFFLNAIHYVYVLYIDLNMLICIIKVNDFK